jgi:hypothetical protein
MIIINARFVFTSVAIIPSIEYTQICIPYHAKIYGKRKLAVIW